MKKTFLLSTTLFALSVIILAACSGGYSASLASEWILVSYGDASNPTPALPDVETSIKFGEDGQFGGSVGCNSFSADYKIDGDQIALGSIVSTMMFCNETSSQESAVLGILSDNSLKFQLNGDFLTLTSADGASAVVFVRK